MIKCQLTQQGKTNLIILKQLQRLLATAILTFMALAGLTAQAAEMPAPPGVLEAYQCSYNPGNDWKDLMAARDYYVKQAGKAGITPEPAFVWSQLKGDAPIDIVWFSAHANLAAFGTALDRDAATPEMAGVLDRFNAVVDCTAGLGVITPTFERVQPSGDGSVLISSFACNLHEGASSVDMQDLTAHSAEVFGSMGDNAPMATYTITPITGSNAADRYIFSTFENATAWTNFVNNLLPSPAGQSLIRHRDAVLDCDLSLWSGQMVVGSLGQE
jgi:hypothetical protein